MYVGVHGRGIVPCHPNSNLESEMLKLRLDKEEGEVYFGPCVASSR